MISPNKQLTIGFVNVEFKDLLLIEEVESSLSTLADGQILQIIKFNASFLLQILLEISIMSIKFSTLVSLAVPVHFNELFKAEQTMPDATNQYE
jgi:hypothetical protein